MKKLFTILILLTYCVISIIAQVIVNPVFDKTTNPRLRIEKVSITTDTTFIYCSFFKSGNEYCDSCILFSNSVQLYDIESNNTFDIANICDLSSKLSNVYRKKMYYIRYSFPAIPINHRYNLSSCFMGRSLCIFGINLQEVFSKLYSISDIDYANEQADILSSEDKITLAIKERERELEASKYVYGNRSKEVALVFYHLASLQFKQNNYLKAIELGEEGFEIDKERTDENKPLAIWYDLNNLSHYYYEYGNYSKAIEYSEVLLKKVQYINGDNREKLATVLTNLSKFNNSLGNYNKALKYAEQALKLKEDLSLECSESYAITLSNLATAKSNLGSYEEAISINKECYKIFTSLYGSSYSSNTVVLQNIAFNYGELNNYTDAITYGEKAYSIYKSHSITNADFVSLVSNLALCYFNLATNKFTEYSDSLFKKALNYLDEAEYTAIQLKNDNSLAHVLNNKAYIIGIKEDAYSILQKACKLSNRYTMECFTYYQNLEHFYLENGSYESALIIQNGTFPNFISRIKENLISIPMDAIKSYWNSRSIYSWLYYTIPQCAFLTQNVEAISELYNTLLLSKGFLLNADLRIKKSVFEEGDSCNVYYMNRMIEIRKKIIADYERNIVLEDLEKEYAECENKLINNSRAYRDYTTNFVTNWIQVQENLGERDIAVEFVRFSVKERIVYAALLLKREYNSPKLIPLFLEEEYQDSLNQEEKYNLIWKPIEEELYNISNIYFSPDGLLYSVGIEYLINNNGQCLHEKYNVYRLSSTKELINNKQGAKYGSAVLFGGIEYELGNEKEDYRQDKINNWNYVSNIHQRSTFDKIENTLSEVQDISTILNYHNIVTKAYTSTNGSEENFKNLSKMKVDIIHIATHGMYVNKEDAMNIKEKWNYRFIVNGKSNRMSEESALTRSFLVMAGGNKLAMHLPYIENDNDGILTALEISELNFKDLEMVVLSACQTGLGDINNEGVIGLQRGFKKAGAHTILMSLDKVDDEATKILMVEFYRNLMDGKTKHQSLKDAQKYLRSVENGKYDDPKYWASFIMLDGLN